MSDKVKAFMDKLHKNAEPNDFQKFHNIMRIENRRRPVRRPSKQKKVEKEDKTDGS